MITVKKHGREWRLRECQRCGSEEIDFIDAIDAPEARVRCSKCGESTEWYSGTENAVEAWNSGEKIEEIRTMEQLFQKLKNTVEKVRTVDFTIKLTGRSLDDFERFIKRDSSDNYIRGFTCTIANYGNGRHMECEVEM
ncbi:MAG: hypothetical protein KBS60_01350 [Phascolarctobacterium sp.]|nr:hypothetical protein [Candidatus Phascolarctobacterium caballi]